jgi:hypothetical protein
MGLDGSLAFGLHGGPVSRSLYRRGGDGEWWAQIPPIVLFLVLNQDCWTNGIFCSHFDEILFLGMVEVLWTWTGWVSLKVILLTCSFGNGLMGFIIQYYD